jgi:hypothetical protein
MMVHWNIGLNKTILLGISCTIPLAQNFPFKF